MIDIKEIKYAADGAINHVSESLRPSMKCRNRGRNDCSHRGRRQHRLQVTSVKGCFPCHQLDSSRRMTRRVAKCGHEFGYGAPKEALSQLPEFLQEVRERDRSYLFR